MGKGIFGEDIVKSYNYIVELEEPGKSGIGRCAVRVINDININIPVSRSFKLKLKGAGVRVNIEKITYDPVKISFILEGGDFNPWLDWIHEVVNYPNNKKPLKKNILIEYYISKLIDDTDPNNPISIDGNLDHLLTIQLLEAIPIEWGLSKFDSFAITDTNSFDITFRYKELIFQAINN